jgi:hypothetical protein
VLLKPALHQQKEIHAGSEAKFLGHCGNSEFRVNMEVILYPVAYGLTGLPKISRPIRRLRYDDNHYHLFWSNKLKHFTGVELSGRLYS